MNGVQMKSLNSAALVVLMYLIAACSKESPEEQPHKHSKSTLRAPNTMVAPLHAPKDMKPDKVAKPAPRPVVRIGRNISRRFSISSKSCASEGGPACNIGKLHYVHSRSYPSLGAFYLTKYDSTGKRIKRKKFWSSGNKTVREVKLFTLPGQKLLVVYFQDLLYLSTSNNASESVHLGRNHLSFLPTSVEKSFSESILSGSDDFGIRCGISAMIIDKDLKVVLKPRVISHRKLDTNSYNEAWMPWGGFLESDADSFVLYYALTTSGERLYYRRIGMVDLKPQGRAQLLPKAGGDALAKRVVSHIQRYVKPPYKQMLKAIKGYPEAVHKSPFGSGLSVVVKEDVHYYSDVWQAPFATFKMVSFAFQNGDHTSMLQIVAKGNKHLKGIKYRGGERYASTIESLDWKFTPWGGMVVLVGFASRESHPDTRNAFSPLVAFEIDSMGKQMGEEFVIGKRRSWSDGAPSIIKVYSDGKWTINTGTGTNIELSNSR
ncbi:MAG: hypothetical protein KJ630_04035 [Proteobacteria bacterium]|nr:hypothetical protein [Pseudomonadota bacterium]